MVSLPLLKPVLPVTSTVSLNSTQVTDAEETVERCLILPGSEICNIKDQKERQVESCEKKVEITKTSSVLGAEILPEDDSHKLEPVESVDVTCVGGKQSSDEIQTKSQLVKKEETILIVNKKVKSDKKTCVQCVHDWWNKYELMVHGLPQRKTNALKHALNKTLGNGSHRIRPRMKGDIGLHIHFKCKEQMKTAHRLVHNQKFLKYRLTAKMLSMEPLHNAETSQEVGEPPAKKVKREPDVLSFLKGTYEEQIAGKMEQVILMLQKVAEDIVGSYPEFSDFIRQKQVENGGVICSVDKFLGSPSIDQFLTWCKFSVGTDKPTREPRVGFNDGNGHFWGITSVKRNYPAHVLEAAKVFEKLIQASEKASAGPCGKDNLAFWRELIIYTNELQDVLLMVTVNGREALSADRIPQLHKELTELFDSEEGKRCRITSVYVKIFYKKGPKETQLVAGLPYLEHTVMGVNLHMLPSTHIWGNIHACEMICKGVAELLAPTERTSVLDVFCGQGLIGLYLSKNAGEVLCLDVEDNVQEAEKNAALNNITNCRYFGGKPDEEIPQLAANMKFDEACAVIIIHSRLSRSCCMNVMEALTRMKKVKRVVLVTKFLLSRFIPTMMLHKPTNKRSKDDDPFFPVKVVPIDTMPSPDGYMLLILMERMELPSLPKVPDTLDVFNGTNRWGSVSGTLNPGRKVKSVGRGTRGQKKQRGQRNVSRGRGTRPTRQQVGRIKGEECRKTLEEEEEENRRQLEECRRLMEEGHRRGMEEEKRRNMEEEEEQMNLRLEQQRMWVGGEYRKQLQEKFKRRTEEVFGKSVNNESERWMRMNKEYTKQDPSSNLRSKRDVIQSVIGDKLREAALPQQLEQVIVKAIETAGLFGQEEKRTDSGRTYQQTQPDSERDEKLGNEFQRWPDLYRSSQRLSEMYGSNKRLSEMYGVSSLSSFSGTERYQHKRDTSQKKTGVEAKPGPPSLLNLKVSPPAAFLGSSAHQRQDQAQTSSRDFGLYARRDQLVDRHRNSPWNASTMENVRKVESSSAMQGHPHNFTRCHTLDWTSETMARQDETSHGFRKTPYSMHPEDGGSRRTK